jgi:L-fuculose-phosphate aldolase
MPVNIQYIHPADQLVMFMQRIYDRSLTTMSGGNLSIMDENGDIWITPKGVDKGSLTRRDIICVKPDGTTIGPHEPSSELPFHASVYKMRPDLHAVLHAHPPALVAFSIVRRPPDLDLIPTVRRVCPEVRFATYAVPGSQELGKNVGKVFAENCDIAMLENHGVCVGAPDMFTAFQRFETLNYTAMLEVLAGKVGKIQKLPPDGYRMSETNYHTKMDDFIPNSRYPEELAARRDMINLIHRSYKMGLFTATHGTYSVRLSDGSFLITPFNRDRAYLSEEDLVRVKSGMKELGKTPSRAVHLHELIYQNNPNIHAILLAHPVHAMAFAVTDAAFDPRTIPESYILLRDVKKLPYKEIYTHPEKMSCELNETHPAVMVENDCVIVTGATLLQAFDRLEVMESTAHSIIESQGLGDIAYISDAEIQDLKKAFNLKG